MKTTLYIIAGSAALILLLMLGIQLWLGAKLRRTAEKEVADRTGGALQLKIGRTSVNLLTRTVKLHAITLRTDRAQIAQWDAGVESLETDIRQIVIRGIHLKAKGDNKHLTLRTIEIDDPRMILTLDTPKKIDTAGVSRKSLQARIVELLGPVHVGRVELRNGDIELWKGQQSGYIANGLTIEADGMQMDTTVASRFRPLFCDNVRIAARQAAANFMTKALMIETDTLSLNLSSGTFAMRHVRLIPQYPKAEYAWKVPGHTDWTQVVVGHIQGQGLDFARFWKDTLLNIDTVTLKDVDIASYKNRKIVRQEKRKPLLSEMVQSVPFGLNIRTIDIKNANAVYEELAADGTQPGRITFDSLNGVFEGLTNRPETPDFLYTLRAQGKVMKAGTVKAVFRFPADPANDHFEVEGSLGPVNMRVFNKMLEQLADAKIRSGKINGLTFTIAGTRSSANVTIDMRYEDLSVALMRERDGQRTVRKLISGIINTVLIKSDNPDRKGLRIGQGSFERDTKRSQFNYLWKTLLAGIKSTVGFPGAKLPLHETVGEKQSPQ